MQVVKSTYDLLRSSKSSRLIKRSVSRSSTKTGKLELKQSWAEKFYLLLQEAVPAKTNQSHEFVCKTEAKRVLEFRKDPEGCYRVKFSYPTNASQWGPLGSFKVSHRDRWRNWKCCHKNRESGQSFVTKQIKKKVFRLQQFRSHVWLFWRWFSWTKATLQQAFNKAIAMDFATYWIAYNYVGW